MYKILITLGATALAFSASAANAHETGEEKLAKLLEGRVAGKPVNCISTSSFGDLRILDDTALVYVTRKTVWVNRTANPKSLDSDDILVTQTMSPNRLCKLDNVNMVSDMGGFFTGSLFLEDFVPYTLPKDSK